MVPFCERRSFYHSKVAPVDKLSLLLIVAMAFVFLGEQPSLPECFGIAMIGAGVMVAAPK